MNIDIREFDGSEKTIQKLANAYFDSYVTVSKSYKTNEEIVLYKKDTFVEKLRKMAKDKSSSMFVYFKNGIPLGFVRYSPVEEYYKNNNHRNIQTEETTVAGHTYKFNRELSFYENNPITSKTMIVNQIYLDPAIQNKGIGTAIFKSTLPKMKAKGYTDFIIEYNANNNKARAFYENILTLREVGTTKDFDNVIPGNPLKVFISPVRIGHTTINDAINHLNKRNKTNTITSTVLSWAKMRVNE